MTPAETFANSRLEAENLIRQLAPARLQDAVIERLLPAIALTATRADDADIEIGASKFGGAPDVPESFAWPMWDERPLSFVAQINLAEIAPFDIEDKLPSSGLLSFFYCMEGEEANWPSGEKQDEGGWHVFHFDSELNRAQSSPESESKKPILTAAIVPKTVWSIPNHPYYINGEQINKWAPEERKSWWKLKNAFSPLLQHLMLGYPRDIQDDARLEVAITLQRGQFDDWLMLLQIDNDDALEFFWNDSGSLFYLMHRDDLANRGFDKCWLIAQGC